MSSKTLGLGARSPLGPPDAHLALRTSLAVPQGFPYAQPGYVLPFIYEPRRFVFVLKNFFGLRSGDTFQCHPRITAIAGSVHQLPLQKSLHQQFLFPGLLYPEAESGLVHLSFNRAYHFTLFPTSRFVA